MKPTFLKAYYSKDQFIEQDQGVSRSYITLTDAPTDLNKFYIYELIPKLESDPERIGQFVIDFQVRSWKHNYADLQVSGLVITDSDYDGDLKTFILGDKSGRIVILKRLYDYSKFQKMQTINIPQPQFTQLSQYNQPMSVRVVGHQNNYVKVMVIMQYGDIYLMQLDDSDLKLDPTWQDFSSTINDPNIPSEFYMIHSFAMSEDRQLIACGLISSNLFKIRVFRLQDITFDYEEIHMEYDLSKIHGISSQDISNSNENTNNIIFMLTQNWPSLAYVTPLMWDTSYDQVGLVQVRPQSIQVRFLGQDIGDTNLFVNQQNLDKNKLESLAISNLQTKQIDRFLQSDKENEDEKMYYYKITINGSNSHSQVRAKEFMLILNTSNPIPEPPGPPDYDDTSSDDDNDDVVLILIIVLVGALIVILLVLIVICCIKRKRDVKKQQEVNEARGRLLNAYAGTQMATIDEEDIQKAGFAMAELQGTMYLIPPQPLQQEHGGQLSAQVLIPIIEEESKSQIQQQRGSRKFNLGVKKSSQRVTGIELQQKLAPPSLLEAGDNDL